MSCSKYRWTKDCDTGPCPGDCDLCFRNLEEEDEPSDLIRREDAIDALENKLDQIDHVPKWVFDALTEALEHLPSAQPEIIRCKDCRHWRERGLCGIWDQYISNGDFYCGCAEKEGEADG